MEIDRKAPYLETDTFCQACGYNLYGQHVFRDSRLGILVCQCPNCSHHFAAGVDQTALTGWTNRRLTVAIILWVMVCVGLLTMATIGMFSVPMSFLTGFTQTHYQTRDGHEVQPQYINGKYRYVRPSTNPIGGPFFDDNVALIEPLSDSEIDAQNGGARDHPWDPYLPFIVGNLVLYFATGLFIAVAFWHWGRRARWTIVLPWVMAILVYVDWKTSPGEQRADGWSLKWLALWSTLDMAGVALGVWIGRPLARFFVRLIVVPRKRHLLGFLWIADGKTPPAVIAPSA